MEFEIISDYGRISQMISANLKKNVMTNTSMTREDYVREISRGSLMAGETDAGLLILVKRPSHIRLNYYIHDINADLEPADAFEAAEAAGWSAKLLVAETAFRVRDEALRQMTARLEECGFDTVLRRVRLSRAAADAPTAGTPAAGGHALSGRIRTARAEDAAAVRRLLTDSFSPVTGCLPEEDELEQDIAEGNFLLLCGVGAAELPGDAAGLLHFRAARRSAEIRHLAVAEGMRGRGFSGPLIEGFLDRTKGLKATVWTGGDNSAALQAYKDCGFEEDGRRSCVQVCKNNYSRLLNENKSI